MAGDLTKDVTVIIPAWNEAETIARMVKGCLPYCEEVVVVDGHSMDGTRERAEEAGARVVEDNGGGKGDAVRTGIQEANHNILIFIDADGSHDPVDIPLMVKPLSNGEAQMTLASRMTGGSDELHGNWTNFVRMVGAGLLTLLLNYRWKTNLTDTLNGFRGIVRDYARQLDLRCDGFEIELEMIVRVLKKGGKIREIPSHEYERQGGRSKLPTTRGFIFMIKAIPWLF